MNKIKLKVVAVYGRERYYADCPLSDLLIIARCTKCIGQRAISALAKKIKIEYTALEPSEFLDSIGAKKV